MPKYQLDWQDSDGRRRMTTYYAADDTDAQTVAARLHADSRCARDQLRRLDVVANYGDTPDDPSTVDAVGMMVYEVAEGSPQRVYLPDPTQIGGGDSDAEPLTTTIVGVVQTEEGGATTAFRRVYWQYRGN